MIADELPALWPKLVRFAEARAGAVDGEDVAGDVVLACCEREARGGRVNGAFAMRRLAWRLTAKEAAVSLARAAGYRHTEMAELGLTTAEGSKKAMGRAKRRVLRK